MVEENIQVASPSTSDSRKRKAWIWGFFIVVLLGALFCLIYWWFWLRFEEYTDDAYVSGNMVALTPQIPGIVVSINADETDIVEKDQIIIELDPTDATLAFETRKAEFAESLRMAIGLFEKVGELRAQREESEAKFWLSANEYERRKSLVEMGGVSVEDFQNSEADLRVTFGAAIDKQHALIAAVAQVENSTVLTHPMVISARERMKEAYVFLQRCKIAAPVTGMIAQRKAQVGEHVKMGTKLLAIVPLDQIWVYANYKEVQLKKMRIGQPVKIITDIYGSSLPFHGKILGLAAGTGSVFSIIPPQNATGNWIKIVQRLPVRISLDPEEIRQHPLRLGLSVETTVDLHDLEGCTLPEPKSSTPVYQTDVFERQLEGCDEVIEQVIAENVDALFLEERYYEQLFGSQNE